MGLFSKKFDYDKDSLMIVFDLNTESYKMSKWGSIISNKKLNWKTIKILGEYNDKLKSDKELFESEMTKAKAKYEQEQKSEKRGKELRELGYESTSFKVMGFEPGSISQSVLDYLIPILSEEHVLIGIHRTGMATIEDINNIFEKGFFMSGHGFNVIQRGGVPLWENFGYYNDNMEILEQIKYASGYKGSKGSILIRIPDEDLKDNKMYDETKSMVTINSTDSNGELKEREVENISRVLKREYIIGYVPVDENFNVEKIILNPHYGEKKEEKNENKEIDHEVEKIAEQMVEEMANNTNEIEETINK